MVERRKASLAEDQVTRSDDHSADKTDCSFEVLGIDDPTVPPRWGRLHESCPQANLYNGWSWMRIWSGVYELPLQIVFVLQGSETVGAFALVHQSTRRRMIPVRVACLGPCSADPHDIYLEYNQFLYAPGRNAAVGRSIASFTRDDPSWQELRLVGMEAEVARTVLDYLPTPAVMRETPCYFVRLAGIEDPLQLCSGNTRAQIRRSNRLLSEMGGRFEVAEDADAAHEFLGQLIDLHQRDWQDRGFPGSFSSRRFAEFHRQAVDHFFPKGAVYLARMRTSDDVLGVVYGFLAGRRYDFYQSGLKRMTDNRIKLGYSLHYHAMLDLGRKDVAEYDFLAGTERYKSCWGGTRRTMIWAHLQRPLLRFRLEAGARRFVRAVRRARG